jgi:hypothetical protein
MLLALALIAAALTVVASAHAAPAKPHAAQRLVVRGQDTVTDGGCDGAGCTLQLSGGRFRGGPVGTGAYTGTIRLHLTEAYSNGEGGVCAPVDGVIMLGIGTPDRLGLTVAGDSCQDGAGDPRTSSFTTVALFKVVNGTGAYRNASGSGIATFSEDAEDHEHLTLIGRLSR